MAWRPAAAVHGELARLRADRGRLVLAVLAGVVVVASSIWFFTARDARGRTARLTADAWYYHAYLPSLTFDRDLDFSDEYRITNNWYRFGTAPSGTPANVFGVGPAIYELPFFAAGHVAARVTGNEADGFSRPEVELALYASLLASLAALAAAYRLLRRRLGGRAVAAAVPLLIACAGPVVYYAVRQPGYAHPFATLFAAWLVERWDRSFDGREQPRSLGTWLALGALIGAAALARPQLALWAVLGVWAAADDLRRARRHAAPLAPLVGRWLAGALLSLVIFAPQLLVWHELYGQWVVTPQGEGFLRWDAPAWSETLFSSRNGLFPWAPLYALAAAGLVAGRRRWPRLTGALLIGTLLQAVANGAAWDWWAGGSFGGRRFDSCFIAFCVGLAALAALLHRDGRGPRWPGARAALHLGAALAACLALANLQLAARTSAPTARIHGGQRAAVVIDKLAPGPFGAIAALASRAANVPARALFSLRYGVPLETYDYVVGVHYLGELYPGLNSVRGKRVQALPLEPDRRGNVGLEADPGGASVLVGDRARLLLGFNRKGPVAFTLRAQGPAGSEISMHLNGSGRALARAELDDGPVTLRGNAPRTERGTNILEIVAPPGTRLLWLRASSPVNAAGVY